VRDEKNLTKRQWAQLYRRDAAPAVLGASTVWCPYRGKLTPAQILDSVLFNTRVDKGHRAKCWGECIPQLDASAVNALLAKDSIVCADVFTLPWKGQPIHKYISDLDKIQLYFNRSPYSWRSGHKREYETLFSDLERIYPSWKRTYTYKRNAEFPCILS
jgi:hypothetical protein